jgi:hypothetical protein
MAGPAPKNLQADSGVSNLAVKQKSQAAQYWDNKTTELVIPEMEAEGGVEENIQVQVAEPAKMEMNMTNLRDLDRDLALNVPSTFSGIDISFLTQVIRPIADLIETDMNWDYLSLQAEIGQNYREKYAEEGSLIESEGARANNI